MPETRFKIRSADTDSVRTKPSRTVQHPAVRRFNDSHRDTHGPLARRRCAWRQRMIEAERGLRLSLRMDGTLFVHLFVASCVIAAGCVLGLSAQQWAIVSLAITVVISAETFNQMLRALCHEAGHHLPPAMRDAVQIGAAALLLASIGSGAAIVLVFADRLRS